MPKPVQFVMTRRIEFADLDAYAVCHFTSFIKFFETATFELLKNRGVLEALKRHGLRFAVRNVRATYSRRGSFDDELEVSAKVCPARPGDRKWIFVRHTAERREPVGDPTHLARGRFALVLVDASDKRMDVPDEIRALLGEGPPSDGRRAA